MKQLMIGWTLPWNEHGRHRPITHVLDSREGMVDVVVDVVGKGILKLAMEADDRDAAIEGALMTI